MSRVLSVFLTALLVLPAAAASQAPLAPGAPIPGLPGFSIRETRNPQGAVEQVLVLHDGQQVQSLPMCADLPVQPTAETGAVGTADFNFDGYPDIAVNAGADRDDNQYYCIFLFDPATRRFVADKQLSQLPDPLPNPTDRTIVSQEKESCGGGLCYWKALYEWENGSLLPLRVQSKTADPLVSPTSSCRYVYTLEERKAGKLTEVERNRVDAGGVTCIPHVEH